RLTNRLPDAPQVSALTGEWLEQLKRELARPVEDRWARACLLGPYADGGRLAELYALGAPVEEREDTEDGVLVIARLPRRELPRFAPYLVAESRSHRESA